MTNIRLPAAVCAAAAAVLEGSHQTLEALFEEAGVPGHPPDLPHGAKWKTWLFHAGADPNVDSLAVLGRLIEEFMDLPPLPPPPSSAFEDSSASIMIRSPFTKRSALDSMLSSKSTASAILGADKLSQRVRFRRVRYQRPRIHPLIPKAHQALKNYYRRYLKVYRERCTLLSIDVRTQDL